MSPVRAKKYKPGEYVLAPKEKQQQDKDLTAKGEKPSVYLDYPVDVRDYELLDLFNWQDQVKDMISSLEWKGNHLIKVTSL